MRSFGVVEKGGRDESGGSWMKEGGVLVYIQRAGGCGI